MVASVHVVVKASYASLRVVGVELACASCQGSCSSGAANDDALGMDSCKACHVEDLVVVYVFLAILRLRNQRRTLSHFVCGHPSCVQLLSTCHQLAFGQPGSHLSCSQTPPGLETGSGASAAQSSCAGPVFPVVERPLAVSLVLPS